MQGGTLKVGQPRIVVKSALAHEPLKAYLLGSDSSSLEQF